MGDGFSPRFHLGKKERYLAFCIHWRISAAEHLRLKGNTSRKTFKKMKPKRTHIITVEDSDEFACQVMGKE
jgi:hypothetical protein